MKEEIRKLKFEEKNIKIVQELLMKYENEEKEPYEINYKELEAIRSILNLYLSEKEKNKELSETNKKLYETGLEIGKQNIYTSENYIRKEKIRQKYHEALREIDKAYEEHKEYEKYDGRDIARVKANTLEELLEE